MFGLGAIATVLVISVLLAISGIKILKEYERAVVFRLGRLVKARGPGITYVIPFVEKMMRVDLRTVTMDVPPQDVITRDNVSIKVSAVLYFRVNRAQSSHHGSAKLSFRQFSTRPGNTPEHLRAGAIGRAVSRKGQDQCPNSGDPGLPNRAVGNQSGLSRTEGHRSSPGDAAGDGQAGGGGERAACKDNSRRRRISSLAEARRCG